MLRVNVGYQFASPSVVLMNNPYQSPKAMPVHVASGQPSEADAAEKDRLLGQIKKEAQNAMFAGVFSFFLGFILSPIAIMCGRRALRMIVEHNVGQEFANTAKRGIRLGYFGLILLATLGIAAAILVSTLIFSMSNFQAG